LSFIPVAPGVIPFRTPHTIRLVRRIVSALEWAGKAPSSNNLPNRVKMVLFTKDGHLYKLRDHGGQGHLDVPLLSEGVRTNRHVLSHDGVAPR
jgi:hypothetical protein